jgi:anaerobic magnesium-protoporphyrin IX monomethyl ester cyclase
MNILFLSMPDSFEHMPTVAVQMPNGALTSLAGNIDTHHRVAVADLVLVQGRVRPTIERLVREFQPHIVGLSVMSFQRRTAEKIIRLVRWLKPDILVAVGGYDPSLAPEAYMEMPGVDLIVRGEGELTFRELLRALEQGATFGNIPGLSWHKRYSDHPISRSPDSMARRPDDSMARFSWVVNPDRPVHSLDDGEIKLPNRAARVLKGYHMLGRPVDVVETSRGCTFDCSFCSIIEMRGRNFHTYTFDRVIADIADAKAYGARSIFLVDDNITLNIHRFETLCRAIIEAGLNDIDYIVQGMTSAIANHGETLAPLMRRAGFRYVFLGIENILEGDLAFLKAAAKNAVRDKKHVSGAPFKPAFGLSGGNATLNAIDYIHRNKMYVVGGLIVGNPDDTRESIEANLRFAYKYLDWPYIQHPTPYPRTPMTRDFIERNLIINHRLHEYDGTTAVVKTEHVEAEEIEYLRWRAERWMKVRHIPDVIRHDPWFVLRKWPWMLAHTFRGSTLRSALGLEDGRQAFRRYKARREIEREYV